MVIKYSFGEVFKTDSVIAKVPPSDGAFPFMEVDAGEILKAAERD